MGKAMGKVPTLTPPRAMPAHGVWEEQQRPVPARGVNPPHTHTNTHISHAQTNMTSTHPGGPFLQAQSCCHCWPSDPAGPRANWYARPHSGTASPGCGSVRLMLAAWQALFPPRPQVQRQQKITPVGSDRPGTGNGLDDVIPADAPSAANVIQPCRRAQLYRKWLSLPAGRVSYSLRSPLPVCFPQGPDPLIQTRRLLLCPLRSVVPFPRHSRLGPPRFQLETPKPTRPRQIQFGPFAGLQGVQAGQT